VRCIRSSHRQARSWLSLENLEDRTVPSSLATLAYNDLSTTPVVAKAFLTDLYQDVLFRAPSPRDLAALSSDLTSGKLTPGGAFANLVGSSEFKSFVDPVLTIYQAYLGRPAEMNGLSSWVQLEKQGVTLAQIATGIAQSPEFQALHGDVSALTNDAFVSFLYQTLYERAPDPAGLAIWNAQSSSTAQRGDLLVSFLREAEFGQTHTDSANQNVVNTAYLGLWNHAADNGFAGYVAGLANGTIPDAASLATQFINSPEYQSIGATRNYVLALYQGVLNREPDWTGYRSWRDNLLSQALTDKQAYADFLKSTEFQTVNQSIELLYEVYLGRATDGAGLSTWMQAQRSGATMDQVAGAIASSAEFQQMHGNVLAQPPADFVTFLYTTVLGRTPAKSEVDGWTERLASQQESRGQLLTQFLHVPEFQTSHADLMAQISVDHAYQTILGRNADSAGKNQWVSFLNSGASTEDLAGQFLVSSEFSTQAFSQNIKHVVVVYQENWSFDSLYPYFPGANGLANAGDHVAQVDKGTGAPLTQLPQPLDASGNPDTRFPPANGDAPLPVQPYDMTRYVAANQKSGDIVHRFYQEQAQIDGGKMDQFVTWSDNGGLTFSYLDATNMPEGKLAQQYTMDDNFFHSAYGGSFLNHMFLAAAAPPVFPNAPDSTKPVLDANGKLQLDANGKIVKDGNVTPDNYAVNTTFSANLKPPFVTDTSTLLPSLNDSDPTQPNYMPTLGDRLSDGHVSWKWYSGGWDDALAGHADPLFQWHHQPYAYFDNYAPGTKGQKAHLQDEQSFFDDVYGDNLPAVSFIKPLGPDNEHPGYADLARGQQHVADIVQAIQDNPTTWANTAIIVTYDENGGRWDHVSPPARDRWGMGSRVPAIVISPFANRGFVDHTQYETLSILSTIEQANGLTPLNDRDAKAAPLFNSFSFSPTGMAGTAPAPDRPFAPGPRDGTAITSNGWFLTPAGKQVTLGDKPYGMALSPDGKTLVVSNDGQSTQSLMVLDRASGGMLQTIRYDAPEALFLGVAFSPDGTHVYASAGGNNKIRVYTVDGQKLTETAPLQLPSQIDGTAINLFPAGLAVSADGGRLYVADNLGDRASVIDLASGNVLANLPVGHNPYTVVLSHDGKSAYVSNWGENTVSVIDTSTLQVTTTIQVDTHPSAMTLNPVNNELYVANSDSDTVSVIDTTTNLVLGRIGLAPYPDAKEGSSPDALTVSADGRTLYVANATNNDVAVASLQPAATQNDKVVGLIPTAWYPTGLALSPDGATLYVLNAKGEGAGPNSDGPNPTLNPSSSADQYIGSMIRGSMSIVNVPDTNQLQKYTAQVIQNNGFDEGSSVRLAGTPQEHVIPLRPGDPTPIKHVIYVVKENRTYDQVLGSLAKGNGDPGLNLFGDDSAPNQRELARRFVTLDNFYADSEVSADGWNWATGALANTYVQKNWPANYSSPGRNRPYDFEGGNSATSPGSNPADAFIWNKLDDAHIDFRNYGFRVFGGQVADTDPRLAAKTDFNFQGYDLSKPDSYSNLLGSTQPTRIAEWLKEFNQYEANSNLPAVEFVRLPNDHTSGSRAGAPTPQAYVADNDWALGQLVEAVSHSKDWMSTAIFVVEDDAQNGPDHVDAHRTIAQVISPYTQTGQVDSTFYSQVSMLRTIELIVGLAPMTQYDAAATPMLNSFSDTRNRRPYTAIKPAQSLLDQKNLAPAPPPGGHVNDPYDWSMADQVPEQVLNQMIWQSVRGQNSQMPTPKTSFRAVDIPSDEG
jgi:acid phosphatase